MDTDDWNFLIEKARPLREAIADYEARGVHPEAVAKAREALKTYDRLLKDAAEAVIAGTEVVVPDWSNVGE